MPALASLVCGFIFGWGLLISGMVQPAKILGFLDVFGIPSGAWDPSLAVVMAAALAVTSVGYALTRPRPPLLDTQARLPTQTAIDQPLIAGAAMFGVGWGLAGLCPGPALENLATLSSPVFVFVVAMAVGMAAHDFWRARTSTTAPGARTLAPANAADG
jgi:uncharacterized membrane protein YedE/YeeE